MGIRGRRSGLHFDKSEESSQYHSDFYESDKNYELEDLNKDVPKFFDNDEVKAVQVIWELVDEETGHRTMVSRVISRDAYDILDQYVGDYCEDSIGGLDQYEGYGSAEGSICVRVMT